MIRGPKKIIYDEGTHLANEDIRKSSLSLGMFREMHIKTMTCYFSSIKVTKINQIIISNTDMLIQYRV